MSEPASIEYMTFEQYGQCFDARITEPVESGDLYNLAILLNIPVDQYAGILTVGSFIGMSEGDNDRYTGRLFVNGALLAAEGVRGWRQDQPGLWRPEGHEGMHVPTPHNMDTNHTGGVGTPDHSSLTPRRVAELIFLGPIGSTRAWDEALTSLVAGYRE